MKPTLEKGLIVDTSSIRKIIEREKIEITWIEKDRQISDVLTKAGVSYNNLLNALSTSKMISL